MASKKIIRQMVLPGEPLDGSGRICIHLFVQDERGLFVEPYVQHQAVDENGQLIDKKTVARPTRGRLACDPKRPVAPITRNGVTTITSRTNSPEAVTCPKCKASKEYLQLTKTGE